MRTLYITPHLSTGGLPRYLIQQVEKKLDLGEEVWVVEWSNIAPIYCVQKDILSGLLGDRLVSWPQGSGDSFKSARLYTFIKECDFDIIHIEEFPEGFLSAEVIAFIYGNKRAYQIYETTHDSAFGVSGKTTHPDKFEFVSNYHAAIFKDYGVEIEVVPYELASKKRPSRSAALESLGLDPSYKHILNVGLFTPGKNQSSMVEIARTLWGEPVHFHFVGNQAGNFKDYWEPLNNDMPSNCTLWGERSDVDAFYSCMDLLLFTSKSELMPLVPIEALSHGMKVMMYDYAIYDGRFDGLIERLDGQSVEDNSELVRKSLGLGEKREVSKVKLVHLLTRIEDEREQKSMESLEKLQDFGVDYVQNINEVCEEYPIGVVALQEHKEKNPGYYGCYQSFRKAVEVEFTPKVDYLLLCECDCVLEVSAKKFSLILERACEVMKIYDIGCITFGHQDWSTILEKVDSEFNIIDKFSGAQCVLLSKNISTLLKDELKSAPWDVMDLWLEYFLTTHSIKTGMYKDQIASQYGGFSLLDNKTYSKNKKEVIPEEGNFDIVVGEESITLATDRTTSWNTYKEIFILDMYNSKTCCIKEGDICVDLGANVGMFSLYALSQGAERVISVDPVGGNVLELLKRNLEKFPSKTTLINKALGDSNGQVSLFNYTDDCMSTTEPDMLERYGSSYHESSVDEVTLSELAEKCGLEGIDFLKLDIEGSEYTTILSTPKEFFNKVDKIAIEYHAHPKYSRYDLEEFLNECGFHTWFSFSDLYANGFGILYGSKEKPDSITEFEDVKCVFSFLPQPKIELFGDSELEYDLEFIDSDTSQVIYKTSLGTNRWASANRKYFTNWLLQVSYKGEVVDSHSLDLKDKKVLIGFGSKSLGDTIAWFPYIEEFQKKHSCEVYVSTFWNKLFRDNYPDLHFITPGSVVQGVYVVYELGCFDEGLGISHKEDWRVIPMQKIATDILGLDYEEKRPRIVIPDLERTQKKDYVSMSEFSTMQCKYWNLAKGWESLISKIKNTDLQVMSVSKEKTKLKKARRCNGKSIEETIRNIHYSKAFIGVGSGLSWLAWAMGVPVVLVSGFSKGFCEFKDSENVSRVINNNVCNGCFNDVEYYFDRGDWNWCPRGEDFICTKEISVEDVFDGLQKVLGTG